MRWAIIFVVAFIAGAALAQSLPPVLLNSPFWHWPALYQASEELVVKQGVNVDGTLNDKVYFRIGWGPCLAIHASEWQVLVDSVQQDRYINMRDYADTKWADELDNWGPDDDNNCPSEPDTPISVEEYVFL